MDSNDFIILIEGKEYLRKDVLKKHKKIDNDILDKLEQYKIIENKDRITFSYVGLIAYSNINIIILPKCYNDFEENITENDIINLIKVLKIYKKTLINVSDGRNLDFIDYNYKISEIGLAERILNDYCNYGLIKIDDSSYERNNNGEVDWEKTIDNIVPVIYGGYPIYSDTINKQSANNIIIKSIHTKAINYCIQRYSWILDYNLEIEDDIQDSSSVVCDEDILNILDSLIPITYKDREIEVLKLIYSLYQGILSDTEKEFSLYGTRHFYYIWEDICKFILNDEYDIYNKFINKPIWFNFEGIENSKKNTIQPDIIRYVMNKICIFDAKFYDLKLIKDRDDLKVSNNPGMGDIIKQYVYEKVFRENKNIIQYEMNIDIDDIYNIFIFPNIFNDVENKLFEIIGGIRLDFFKDCLIINVCFSLRKLFDMYIRSISFTENEINLFIRQVEKYIKEYKKSLSLLKRYITYLYISGEKVKNIGEKYNIDELTIMTWVKQ